MEQHGQVKIGPEFFTKIKLDYANWQWALVREFLQNSFDAPGCSQVIIRVQLEADGNTTMVVANNGAPMTKEILFGKLLTLGGSGKNFEGENTGGFGVAKSLLYYCHLGYSIATGDIFVQGTGAEYRVGPAVETVNGTDSMIRLEGDQVGDLVAQCRRFAQYAQWKGKLVVNGEELPCRLLKGYRRKDLGWGVVYTNTSFSHLCIVRINGQPMFACYTRYKGCVLIELAGKACDSLTSNRDALKGHYQSELSDFLTALAVDKKSALREQRAEYKRFAGEKIRNEAKQPKAAEGGLDSIGVTSDVAALLAQIGSKGEPDGLHTEIVPPTATEGGIKLVVVSKEDEEDTTISLGPQFILKNTTGMKTPIRYVPGEEFSQGSREIVLAWTAILLKLYQLHNVGGEFSVGFVLDDESEAEHETGVYGRVYYINPAKVAENDRGRRCMESRYTSAWSDRLRIITLAAHEFVHGLGYREHDEDYAGKLTDVTWVCMKNLQELEALCKAAKEQHEKRPAAERVDLFGHAISAVIRWMGKAGWKYTDARHVLDAKGLGHVAEGTIRTYLQAGKQGLRGAPAELTAEQSEELESLL